MTPAKARGFSPSQIISDSGGSDAPPRRESASLCIDLGGDDDFFAGDLVIVEHVERLADFEHHEVADIDHVIDTAHAARFHFLLQPVRGGADFDAGHSSAGVAGALPFVDELDLDQLFDRILPLRLRSNSFFFRGRLSWAERSLANPKMLMQWPRFGVRDDIENHIAIVSRQDRSRRQIHRPSSMIPSSLRPKPELVGCAQHPERFDIAQFALFDLERFAFLIVQFGADLCESDSDPRAAVGSAADHLERFGSIGDFCDGETVGRGVFVRLEHLAHHNSGKVERGGVDPFHFDAGER